MQADRPVEALWHGQDAAHRYVAVQFSGLRAGATMRLDPLPPLALDGPEGLTTLPSGVRLAAGPRAVEVAVPLSLATPTVQVECRAQRLPEAPLVWPVGE
jgi:hypothetical protein